jgi:vacuolar protein sorting-associated protein 54
VHAHPLTFTDYTVRFPRCSCSCVAVQVMGLRKAIIQQAKDFLESFHERCSCELQAHMESEQWAAVNVPEQIQALVDSLLAGLDSPNADAPAAAAIEAAPLASASEPAPASATASADSTGNARSCLVINGEKVHCAASLMSLMKLLRDHLVLLRTTSSLGGEIVARILRLVRQFNDLSHHLILEAGAVPRTLRTVTASNLALCSQHLSALLSLLPTIRLNIAPALSSKSERFLGEFDTVLQELRGHRQAIFAKLLEIMQGRIALHLSAVQQPQWEFSDADAVTSTSSWVVKLVKEMGSMHKQCAAVLPHAQVKSLFSSVIVVLNDKVAESLTKMPRPSPQQRNRMYNDLVYLLTSVRDMGKTVPDPGSTIMYSLMCCYVIIARPHYIQVVLRALGARDFSLRKLMISVTRDMQSFL